MKDMVCLIIMRIFCYVKRFFFSIKRYLFHSIMNFVELVAQIMVFVAIVTWLKINTVANKDSYEFSKIQNSTDMDFFYNMEIQSQNFQFYRQTQALTIFLLILQNLKYVYFSKRLSKFLDIISNAQLDYIFYVFMFSIVIIAYSVMAYFTFGVVLNSFSSFPKSLLNCLMLLIGNVDFQPLMDADSTMGLIFYFSFNVHKISLSFILIYLN